MRYYLATIAAFSLMTALLSYILLVLVFDVSAITALFFFAFAGIATLLFLLTEE